MNDVQTTLYGQLDSSPAAKTAYDALTNAGGQVYVVGGAVRDSVLGLDPKDIDLMVQGLTGDQITQALAGKGNLNFTGQQFGVYRFKTSGDEVEIAMPRTETSTGPAHTDFKISVDPNMAPEEDLARRDFTGNAMAFNLYTGELIDPFNGQRDLKDGNLKLVNPNAFRDDPLRIVRALVANARFGLAPDPQLIEAMKEEAPSIRNLPGERIQMEMDKLLAGNDPTTAMSIAFDTGLIDYLAPELSAMYGFDQRNPHHDMTVDQHSLAVLRKMAELSNDPDMRLAALFHDSGKPDSFWQDPNAPEGGGGHFYKNVLDDGTEIGQDHQDVSAQLAQAFMDRLRYPNARKIRVVKLVQEHMFPYFKSTKGARKFLQMAGSEPMAWDLLKLREADSCGKNDLTMSDYDRKSIDRCQKLLEEVLNQHGALTTRDLAINGNDLMAMGIPAGPEMGRILNELLEAVVDNPELNTPDILSQMALESASSGQRTTKTARPTPESKEPQLSVQPKWKWSFDGDNLLIWECDPATGRPHHIELTGKYFYTYAQGRIYVEKDLGSYFSSPHDDYIEILVWEDRGTRELQDEAVVEIQMWLKKNLGRDADQVSYQTEGIDWLGLGKTPNSDQLLQHYYGIDPNNEEPTENSSWYTVDDDDENSPTITVYDPAEEYFKKYRQRSFHDMTDDEIEWYDK